VPKRELYPSVLLCSYSTYTHTEVTAKPRGLLLFGTVHLCQVHQTWIRCKIHSQ